jgi:hypothetical protein
MGLKITGFKEVDRELKRIRASMAPNINKAIEDTTKFGNQLAVDGVFNEYGFKSKSYVEQNIGYSINPKNLTGTVYGRTRPSTLNRFATPKYGRSKRGKLVGRGHIIRVHRKERTWFRGTFQFIGNKGNQVMYMRKKGEKWRTFEEAQEAGAKPLYGPSVANSFGYMRDKLEPQIIKHLRERYGHYAK